VSWTTGLWQAQAKGLLTREEAWQVLLDAREAPDPALIVAKVVRGLATAYQPEPPSAGDGDPVVIEGLSDIA